MVARPRGPNSSIPPSTHPTIHSSKQVARCEKTFEAGAINSHGKRYSGNPDHGMKRDMIRGHRHSADMQATTDAFGLIIIGDEILDGRRQDKHMAYAIELMQEHHLKLAWIQVIADEAPLIESTLAWAFAQPRPFFSCAVR